MSFAYGSITYGLGPYGGRDSFLTRDGRGASVVVYKPDGSIRSVYETGRGRLLAVDFVHDECGCKSFTMQFSGYVNILKNDMVKIFIMDSDDCFFTGVVRSVPIDGSTKQEWNYAGFGLNDYFVRINTLQVVHAATTVEAVVKILAVLLAASTPINYNAAKIYACVVPITSLTLHYVQVKEAMDQLKKLGDSDGNTYIYGVDRDGDFFFMPRSQLLKATLIVGKKGRYGIEQYEPEDRTEYRTALYVLDKNGTYVTTVTDLDPTLDVYEEKVTAPDIDAADIPAWAAGTLAARNRDTRQSSVEWIVWEHNPLCLVADGSIRVLSNVLSPAPGGVTGTAFGAGIFGGGVFGGGPVYAGRDLDDLLEVREVSYTIGSSGAMRSISLGSIPADIVRSVKKLMNKVEDLTVSLGL